jgi:hypothetical protein
LYYAGREQTLYKIQRNGHNFKVPSSSAKRAWIVLAVLLLLIVAALGIYFYRQRGPLPALPGVTNNPGPPPDIVSQLPSDAPLVGYVDAAALRRLENSPLAAVLGLTSPGPEADREYAQFVSDTGFDYTRDLDHAAIAFWPANFGSAETALAEERVLAIAEGRFDEQKIKAYALRTGRVEQRGTQSVYDVPGNPPIAMEFLSSTRIVLAAGRNAADLLGTVAANGVSARDSAMQVSIKRVAGAPIFALARTDRLPAGFYANFRNSPQLEHLARSVRSMTLAGQPDANNLNLALDAECDSMKNAFEISTLLDTFRMVGSMALHDPKLRGPMTRQQAAFLASLLNQTKVTHQDKWVRLYLQITPAMLGAPKLSPTGTGSR